MLNGYSVQTGGCIKVGIGGCGEVEILRDSASEQIYWGLSVSAIGEIPTGLQGSFHARRSRVIAFDTIIGVLFGLLVGWFCTRSPQWLAKFIDCNILGDPNEPFALRKFPDFAVCIRTHPETWHLRYPLLFRAIRFTGWLAFAIVGVILAIMFFASIGVTLEN
jgi:hypothetical protein